MKNNKSIQAQVMSLAVALIVVSVFVGAVGGIGSLVIASFYQTIPDVNVPNLNATADMLTAVRTARVNLMGMVSEAASAEQVAKYGEQIEASRANYDKAIADYLAVPFSSPEEEKLFTEYRDGTNELWKLIDQLKAAIAQKPAADSVERAMINHVSLGTMFELAAKNTVEGQALEDYHDRYIQANVTAAQRSAMASLFITILVIAGAGFVGYRYSKKFSTQLSESLLAISAQLNEAGQQVSAAATEISASSQQLSSSTTEQASSLAETAASIEEMSSMVAKNSENSRSAAGVSTEAEETATRGQEGVQNMIASMEQIAASNQQVTEIVKVIREIGEKTKVINDIVFQTKLLSFNASVEAARAGEHGKGFAVVAEEVGNLAQMSGNAAKEISTLLESSVSKVESIVEETKRKVDAGTTTAHESGAILAEIVTGISRVALMAGEISSASGEQATGIGEITKAMNQLDATTQQNAATSEEAASAAEELSAQAESLNTLVGQLVHLVNGDGPAAAAPSAKPAPTAAKVLPLKKVASKPAAVKTSVKMAKAAGQTPTESSPNFDDSRFDDI